MVPIIETRMYRLPDGRLPYSLWLDGLPLVVRNRIRLAVGRVRDGNIGHVKSLGGGLAELKLDHGPGYRVYFGWTGQTVVVILGGGTKHRQSSDIERARRAWIDFKAGIGDAILLEN
jgi:putative addiction module killer protein